MVRDDDPDTRHWHVRVHHPSLAGAMVGRTFTSLRDALDCVRSNHGARLLRHVDGETWARLDCVGTYYVPGSIDADSASAK